MLCYGDPFLGHSVDKIYMKINFRTKAQFSSFVRLARDTSYIQIQVHRITANILYFARICISHIFCIHCGCKTCMCKNYV